MAYRMLCGSLPWGASSGAQALLLRTRRPPPSILDEDPSIAPAIDALLRRAMAVDPKHRFSLRHFEHEMQQISTDGQPVAARTHSPTLRYGEGPTQSVPRGGSHEALPTLSLRLMTR